MFVRAPISPRRAADCRELDNDSGTRNELADSCDARDARGVRRWLGGRSWLLALSLALSMGVGACTVEVQPKGGSDPCDPNPCEQSGVCGSWTGTCTVSKDDKAVCSGWKWSGQGSAPTGTDGKPLTTPVGYEADEKTCDGKDNDCDGLTDETFAGDAATVCGAKGVCAEVIPTLICSAGTLTCNLPTAAGFEKDEVSCDGKDNDCDGETDESAVAPSGTCSRLGVCAGLSAPTCTAGAWDCGYSAASDYEASEVSCDGKDNDCDGLVDSGISAELLAGKVTCSTSGVCSTATIVCKGGQPVCDYASVSGYEAFEQTCDGKDNDCDGKSDNLAGSSVSLTVAGDDSCKSVGVCAAGKTKISRVCSAGALGCDYGAVPGFEQAEVSCDGKDNDCDGQTDEALAQPLGTAAALCGTQGVCKSAKVACNAGVWQCDYANLTGQGYEAFEATCDGKDNDCDGQTDESATLSGAKCLTAGVCGAGLTASCSAGKPVCNYALLKGYEATEASCDGLDNDCDGQTDESDGLSVAASGCSLGVCASGAIPTCGAGKWSCDTTAVTGFEATESLCDNKDNDCDGQTDEGLVSTTFCPSKGVCSGGVKAYCLSGKYMCDSGSLAGYETKETSCDGLDNDCDGQTDTGLCPTSATCTADAQCVSGTCTTLNGGTGKVCAATKGGCVRDQGGGQMTFVPTGTGTCTTSSSTIVCTNGSFGSPTTCQGATPFCESGACVLCKPNAVSCGTVNPNEVVQCNASGTASEVVSTCDSGTKCAGSGACVPADPFSLVDESDAVASAEVLALSSGGFAAVWVAETSGGAVLRVRIYGKDGTPVGAATTAHGNLKPVSGSRLGIAPTASGFAVVWVTQSNGKDIALGLFSSTGSAVGTPSIVNANLSSGDQDLPTISGNGTQLVVAWAGDETDYDGSGIVSQRLSAGGVAAGDPVIANDDPSNFDSTTSGNQTLPVVLLRDNGQFAILWEHRNAQNRSRIRGRLIGSDDAPTAGVLTVSSGSTSTNQTQPALALAGTGWFAAWTSDSLESSGNTGIGVRVLTAGFATSGAPVVANTTTLGTQANPRAKALADGKVAVSWTSADQVQSGSGLDVVRRVFQSTGVAAGSEKVLNASPGTGSQTSPALATFADGRALFVWLSDESGVFLPVAQFD